MALRDASLPAGAIVEELEDGGAMHNDGVKLSPASENVWYMLATVEGEQSGNTVDFDLQRKNCRIWNAYFYGSLNKEEKAKFSEENSVDIRNLEPLNEEERAKISSRLGDRESCLQSGQKIEMKRLLFQNAVGFSGFIFPDWTDFSQSVFKEMSLFFRTCFCSHGFFIGTKFTYASDFADTRFIENVYFARTIFGGKAIFKNCDFRGITTFINSVFESETSFDNAKFCGEQANAPKFHKCELHPSAQFSLDPRLWPIPNKDNAKEHILAYVSLRQIMVELHKPDDQHFFFQREMAAKAFLGPWYDRLGIRLYGWVSDYGWSVARPLCCLAAVWVLGWLLMLMQFQWHCVMGGGVCRSGAFAAGLSFANLFSFLGFGRLYFGDFFKNDPGDWIILISSAQNILGVVFLFFFGLGLRNRFRLK